MSKKIIIAIDGHSSCGKSTLARDIAQLLDITYVDSGAMYRAVTLFLLRNKLEIDELVEILPTLDIYFQKNTDTGKQETYLKDERVEDEIRKMSVSNKVSYVAENKEVRAYLVGLQKKMAEDSSLVMDGRDIGTVVFPKADLKIFMTASPEVRAQRRYDELKEAHPKLTLQEVLDNITNRDFIDENREITPLKKAEDAWVLDNSLLSREEQLQFVEKELKERNLL